MLLAARRVFTGGADGLLEEAHAAGLPLAVHAHGVQAVLDALAVGADSIEHCTLFTADGVDASPELIQRVATSASFISMTAAILPGDQALPPAIARRLDAIVANHATLYRHGARLVCSSDAGVDPNKPHNVLPYGVTRFLSSLGMTNAEAITKVTSVAAEVCGVANRAGTIEVGQDADLLVVGGNPLENLDALHNVSRVYARGRPVALPLDLAPTSRSAAAHSRRTGGGAVGPRATRARVAEPSLIGGVVGMRNG